MTDLSLQSDFAEAAEADWLALVDKALAGAPFSRLRRTLYDGIATEPLYKGASGGEPLFSNRDWQIVLPLPDESLAGANSIDEADALWIDLEALGVEKAAELRRRLVQKLPAYVSGPGNTASAAIFLAAVGDEASGSVAFDPLSDYAARGEQPVLGDGLEPYVDAAFYLSEHHRALTPFIASGRVWHEAGASDTQELAFSLAAAVYYWRALTKAGMPVAQSAGCVGFDLAATADIFLTIAKFRALRLLWRRALEAASVSAGDGFTLLAHMSRRITSAYDPHVNLLRGTAAAFGAALGGATAIRLLPFDIESGPGTALSHRLARNTGLILRHETNITAVADPAAGSAYIDRLTGQLAEKAWALFQEVERAGGLAAFLRAGHVQTQLRATRTAREADIATRRYKITGVSAFPNAKETLPAMAQEPDFTLTPIETGQAALQLPAPGKGERFAAMIAAAKAGRSLAELQIASRTVLDFKAEPLGEPVRDAEPFELIRASSDLAAPRLGSRPPIFLAALGQPQDYRTRLGWAKSFFAIAGIDAVEPAAQGFTSTSELAAAFRQGSSPIACLCSSDAGYGALKGAAAALKEAGASFVYLAGGASALKALDQADASAIDRLIYEGCDALRVLEEARDLLHVEELAASHDPENEFFN